MADDYIREGGDITIDDMTQQPDLGTSEIQNFYANSTVFITGATGFLGKLILEKLLRSCPRIKKIYLLMRPKKGKDIKKRLEEMFDNVIFDRLKREQPSFMGKIEDFSGDCSLPNLGLDDKDTKKLLDDVDVIFHCAATVRFDEKIRTAAYINVRACRDLIRFGKQMKNLRAMIHVSTAYSNCIRKTIEERIYEYTMTGEKLLNLIESLDDETLDKITPTIIGEWPNTYVYTKAIAEEVVKSEGEGLPIAVIRPSIVLATASEPVAGWIDNLYGATGVLVGAAMGVLRSLHADENNLADMVPADYVINNAIVAAWDIAKTKTLNGNREETNDGNDTEIPIFNYVSTPENPITWRTYMKLGEKHAPTVPSPLIIWHYFFALRRNYYWHMFCVFFLHYIPAYIVDFIAICIGKKPMMVKGYEKIGKFTGVISYFSTKEWMFKNDNVQGLWKKLNPRDKDLFAFSMKNFNWDSYFYTYVRGGRVYLLKDPMETIPQGRIKSVNENIENVTSGTSAEFRGDSGINGGNPANDVPVFNYVCTPERPIKWSTFMDLGRKYGKDIPSPLILWHCMFAMVPNYYLYVLRVFLLQTVPAHIVDFVARCIGRKPMMVKAYKKIRKFADVIGVFTTKEWYFTNDNVQNLWRRLQPADRQLFPFSMANLDWNTYFPLYMRGTRVYLLKDPMDTVPEGQIKIRRVKYYHYTLVTILSLIAIRLITWFLRWVVFKS